MEKSKSSNIASEEHRNEKKNKNRLSFDYTQNKTVK